MIALAVFIPLLILYIATGSIDSETLSADPNSAALAAWNWVVNHTQQMDTLLRPNVWFVVTHGHLVTNRTPGVIAWGMPFYWLFGNDPQFSVFPAVLASSVASAGAASLLVLSLRRLLGTPWALATGLTLALGTATWSVSADGLWTHGPDQLFLCGAMFALSRGHRALAAVAIALTVPIRAHLAVVAAVAGVWYSVRLRSVRPLITFGVPCVVTLAALVVYDHFQFDAWLIQGGRPHVTSNLQSFGGHADVAVNILGALVSLDRGLLIWFPLLGVLAFSIRPAWRQAPSWIRLCAVAGIAYFLIQMKVNFFAGGDNFWSYRLTIESLTLAAPLLSYSARHTARHRPVLRSLAVVAALYGLGTQAMGAIFFKPDHHTHNAWWHSNLAHLLAHGGMGPRITFGMTIVVALVAATLASRFGSPGGSS